MALKKTKSKKVAKKKATKRVIDKKAAPKRRAAPPTKKARGKSGSVTSATFEPEELQPSLGGQAGDLQGLSDVADAESESVDELLGEGNALEAGIVKAVEDAPEADQGEIKTHEVPEDDVPEEYLDNEK